MWVKSILIYNQFALSKAFERSTFRMIPLIFLECRECITSWVVPTTLGIFQSCRKANCSGEMYLDKWATSGLQ